MSWPNSTTFYWNNKNFNRCVGWFFLKFNSTIKSEKIAFFRNWQTNNSSFVFYQYFFGKSVNIDQMRHLYLIKFTIFMAKFIVFFFTKKGTQIQLKSGKKQLSILRRNTHNSIKIAFFSWKWCLSGVRVDVLQIFPKIYLHTLSPTKIWCEAA